MLMLMPGSDGCPSSALALPFAGGRYAEWMDETLCEHCGEPQGPGSRCASCNQRVYRYATDEAVDFSQMEISNEADILEQIPSVFDPPPAQPAKPLPRITPRIETPTPLESTFPTPRSRPTRGRPKLGRFGFRGLLVVGFILYRVIQGLLN